MPVAASPLQRDRFRGSAAIIRLGVAQPPGNRQYPCVAASPKGGREREPLPGERKANIIAVVAIVVASLIALAAMLFFWFGYSMGR